MSMRPRQRGNRRRRFAVLGLTLSVLAVVWSTQTAAAPHPGAPVSTYPDPTGGHASHNSQGGASPAPGSSPTGTEHDADAHVDLPQGGQEWSTPDLVAQGALVRIETVADVYVALHHFHVEKYSYTEVSDPQAVATGTFVNAQGLVITSKGALHDDARQVERFGTWGVNRAFVQAEFMKSMPADPFARTTITGGNKGRLADTPPTDPKMNERLQNCYEWETSHHCAVFVVMHQRVAPSVQDKDSTALEGLPQSDARVAALATQPRGITPLTLQLANPEPDTKYWVVSSRGVNEEPLVGSGTLTDSERDPVSAADLAKWQDEFGDLAEGAPVISERGELVAFLGTAEGSDELAAVSSSHMSNDLRTFGLSRDSSPVDAQFQDGLELFEADQFAAAVPKLKVAVEATGGQRVARELLAQAEEKAGTAEDLSDEADVLAATGEPASGWSGAAIAVFAGLVVLVLIGIGIAVATARRRNWPTDTNETTGTTGSLGERPVAEPEPAVALTGAATGGVASHASAAQTSSGHNPPRVSASSPAPPAHNAGGPQTSANKAGGPPASVSKRIGTPTTLFATGTTDAKPDPGDEPTLKRGETPPAATPPPPPARPSGGFCRQCGAQLSPGDRFCYSCGAPSGSPASKG